MSIEYVQQQLGAAERILYTERHHWVFFVAEMIKWILFAAAVLALIILLKVWWLPDAAGSGGCSSSSSSRPRASPGASSPGG